MKRNVYYIKVHCPLNEHKLSARSDELWDKKTLTKIPFSPKRKCNTHHNFCLDTYINLFAYYRSYVLLLKASKIIHYSLNSCNYPTVIDLLRIALLCNKACDCNLDPTHLDWEDDWQNAFYQSLESEMFVERSLSSLRLRGLNFLRVRETL